MLQGIKQTAAHVQQGARQPVQGARGPAADGGGAAALYVYDPAVAGALDARAVAAGQAAEKHLQVVEGAVCLMARCREDHAARTGWALLCQCATVPAAHHDGMLDHHLIRALQESIGPGGCCHAAAGRCRSFWVQEAVSIRPGAALPTWLLFQLLAAGGRAPEALVLAQAAAAAAPHDADAAALAALAAVVDSAVAAGGGGAVSASQVRRAAADVWLWRLLASQPA